MGIEPFLIASAIECVVAQRLVRRLCDECKRAVDPTGGAAPKRASTSTRAIEAYEPVGCSRCNGTGFRGRIGVYEVMRVSGAIRSLILERASGAEIAAAAAREGMQRMRADGLEKVRRGLTSVAEVLRVLDA